ncbi:MAG: hypothetical protein K2W94_09165 [Alphaproteobacteria bacterium]|nr:hypothetical protein [Alphaproteobacteria bacterium]
MSKILDFPRVIAYVIKDAFHLEESKIVNISDYQKDHHKVDDHEDEPMESSPKKPPSNTIEDEDDDDLLEDDDYMDRMSNADKSIYFSSFISF